MNRKYKNLLKNSLLFTISGFSSKILSILVVPLYTFYLTPEQYGLVDLGTMLTQLLVPLVSLSIFESLLRFNISEKNDNRYLNGALFVIFWGSIFSLLCYPLFMNFFSRNESVTLVAIIIFQMVFHTLAQYAKSIDKNKIFAISGFLNTLFTLILNTLFLIILHYGVNGYFLSILLSLVLVVFYLIIQLKVYRKLHINEIDLDLIRDMIIYSLPLIPNSIMWWVMSSLNRPLITFYLSASMTGLFAVANKIPTFLNMFTMIFSQAWQVSALEDSDSKGQSELYSKVFGVFSILLYFLSLMMMLSVEYVFTRFLNPSYFESWTIVPILLISNIFAGFSSFFGITYTVSKKTKGIFYSSLYGAILNLFLNILFLQSIGLVGTALASVFSYLIMAKIRYNETVNFIGLQIDLLNNILNMILLASITIYLYYFSTNIFIVIISMLVFLLINKKVIKELFIEMRLRIYK